MTTSTAPLPSSTHLDWDARVATVGFDKRTRAQSSVLAQILQDHQPITVRGAFYRAVSAGIYPNTAEQHYRQCGAIILKLRRSGLVPYHWIADSTRLRLKNDSWSGLQAYSETVQECYRKNLWGNQKSYLEVCVEKDAMSGVLRPVTEEYDVFLNVTRGNASETFVHSWAAALNRIKKPINIYYLGDHDPNGLDIERDLKERLGGFVTRPFTWKRLAINSTDFQRSDLIAFPIRTSNNSKAWNKRCQDYAEAHGDRCIECDAIPPNEIRERLRSDIESHVDMPALARLREVEDAERETIRRVFSPDNLGGEQ